MGIYLIFLTLSSNERRYFGNLENPKQYCDRRKHVLRRGVDTGPIVLRRKFNISKENPLPIDFLKAEYGNCKELLSEFIDLVLEDNIRVFLKITIKPLFPWLFTEVNGAIDWDWNVELLSGSLEPLVLYPGTFELF